MVNFRPVLFVIGLVLSKLALFMYVPTLVAFITGTDGFIDFGQAVIITHLAAFICLSVGRTAQFKLSVRDMFLITSLVWTIASAFAALPFVFINHISFTDAYFETMSGITTTGSTVLSGLDNMAPSILLWRSILQWLGGVGFIVMAVAILPMLNVGGMRLFQTESSDWSDKSSPRAKTVAKNIVAVYLILTLLCMLGYLLTGMTPFEAINHAFTTLSTGGYSTSDGSMNHFSKGAHWIGTLFMFLGGLPFLLFVAALRKRKPQLLFNDAQVRGFAYLFLTASLIVAAWLCLRDGYTVLDALRVAMFNIVSVLTTTGYGLGDFTAWGALPTTMFAFLMMVGACSGSTSGGIKIFRFQIATSMLHKQMMKLIHPSGVFVQRYNQRPVNEDIIRSVVAFGLTYFMTIIVIAGGLSAMGLDPITSISGSITAVANVGPGMGPVIGPTGNFAPLPDAAKWLLSLGMLMGRLEILTLLVLFFPAFWKR
ncbi:MULTISPECIES: TrkH family potassium uptake protein [Vibrio]|uniref:Trk system potassium uptake protein n=1 Tax=Vibrio proteolyticus NBRC 13287 TaxID=1219065 RepID=U3BH90_VIBPR|nr:MULTISPECIES: TrkH family potassium uptake protein [Vibrio]NAW59445.1 potassium transporter TrkH [Vibrio sp. V36_P2S2PM302]NAX23111.1 potassium transporter TrkH [Vibrio sp. V39_P1S14PM300]NAX26201.1 potassium transporter TrkH [Vibrio sp. V38_P2S17PM301]NAX31254.1 potassium transporter TrkH [Vibrio sp. V37_P2S8PM304]GAD69024.1 Trk system potassium uptake protein TrkH [Vibrio proteolyticus NBRC 13287]